MWLCGGLVVLLSASMTATTFPEYSQLIRHVLKTILYTRHFLWAQSLLFWIIQKYINCFFDFVFYLANAKFESFLKQVNTLATSWYAYHFFPLGTLIQEELIPKSVIECSLENKMKTVFVTKPFQNFQVQLGFSFVLKHLQDKSEFWVNPIKAGGGRLAPPPL